MVSLKILLINYILIQFSFVNLNLCFEVNIHKRETGFSCKLMLIHPMQKLFETLHLQFGSQL